MKRIPQEGFTLIELMIGMLVGLITVAATVSAVTAVVLSNRDYLKMTRLNQELSAAMNLMIRDLRRAGYSGAADGSSETNDFMTQDLAVPANYTDIEIAAGNSCITFTYDADGDGVVDTSATDERFGYRLNGGAVEFRKEGKKCDESGWEDLTDPNAVNITGLTFVQDLNYVTAIAIRYIDITLSGHILNDPAVARTISERVRVRNDRPN